MQIAAIKFRSFSFISSHDVKKYWPLLPPLFLDPVSVVCPGSLPLLSLHQPLVVQPLLSLTSISFFLFHSLIVLLSHSNSSLTPNCPHVYPSFSSFSSSSSFSFSFSFSSSSPSSIIHATSFAANRSHACTNIYV